MDINSAKIARIEEKLEALFEKVVDLNTRLEVVEMQLRKTRKKRE